MRCAAVWRLPTPDSDVSHSNNRFDDTSAEWQHCCPASTESPTLAHSSGTDQRRAISREVECRWDAGNSWFTGLYDGTTSDAVATPTSSVLLVTLATVNGSIVAVHYSVISNKCSNILVLTSTHHQFCKYRDETLKAWIKLQTAWCPTMSTHTGTQHIR